MAGEITKSIYAPSFQSGNLPPWILKAGVAAPPETPMLYGTGALIGDSVS